MRKLFFLLLLLPCFAVSAQVPEVEIELDKSQFKDRLPFDIQFKVKGALPNKKPGVTIHLTLAQKEPEKKKNYFNDGVQILSSEFKSGNEGTFKSFAVGPIKPNLNYEFKFKTYTPIIIDRNSTEFTKLLDDIYDTIDIEFKNLASIESIDNLNITLTQKFLAFLSKKEGKELTSDMVVTNSKEPFFIRIFRDVKADKYDVAFKTEQEAKKNINGEYNDYLANYNKDNAKQLSEQLEPENQFEGNLTEILSSADGLKKFFENHPDVDIDNLVQGLNHINSTKFDKRNQIISEIVFSLGVIKTDQPRAKEAERNLKKLRDELKEFFNRVLFISEKFLVAELVEIDVLTDRTPYVSLDAGLNVRIGDVLNQFHTYQGANIYLRPVDKRAPLGYFKWGTKILKMFAFNIGISQRVGTIINPDFRGSISDNSYLLLGAGLRVTRIFKLNYNYIFFKLNPKNPIIDNPRLRAYPFLSFSVDINIAKALGSKVGGFLGI